MAVHAPPVPENAKMKTVKHMKMNNNIDLQLSPCEGFRQTMPRF